MTSTTSMASVGISASITRRTELAVSRLKFCTMNWARWLSACTKSCQSLDSRGVDKAGDVPARSARLLRRPRYRSPSWAGVDAFDGWGWTFRRWQSTDATAVRGGA
jgi:hypothetical protein